MSARSSRRELAILLVAFGFCLGCGSKKGPQGDPAAFAALANTMINNVPVPGAPQCSGQDVIGGVTMTMRTLLQIAKRPFEDKPERREFTNPPDLDAPAARVLLDEKASEAAKRGAAGELALAPFYLIYMIDSVDVPMALGFKELKLGIAAGRALKYDRKGNLMCARVFFWHNDENVSEDAIAKSNKAVIDPAIAKLLRDDLTAQLLKRIAALPLPPPVAKEMSKKPSDH